MDLAQELRVREQDWESCGSAWPREGDFAGEEQESALVPIKQWVSFLLSENSPSVFLDQRTHCKVTAVEESAGVLQGLNWGFSQTIWGAEVLTCLIQFLIPVMTMTKERFWFCLDMTQIIKPSLLSRAGG